MYIKFKSNSYNIEDTTITGKTASVKISYTFPVYINYGDKIIEVDFDFVTFNPFATIPVSVYRQIEIQLKEKVWFVPTEFGKGLNYIYLCWNYDF